MTNSFEEENPKISYCQMVKKSSNPLHKNYHDNFYGFPVNEDQELFARLSLEINQAGLSWTVVLNKEKTIREAFQNFNIKIVANYTEKNIEKLLRNQGIIRNHRKIQAIIYNAKKILEIQKIQKNFHQWLIQNYQTSNKNWIQLFQKNFKFTGKEITIEFLKSIGFIKGAHQKECPIYKKIENQNPIWKNYKN